MAARRRTGHSQGELFLAEPAWPPAAPSLPSGAPDLAFYDLIVANISGGKDSQTMLRVLVTAAIAAGIPLSRIVCVFADLGEADEWPGTAEIAAEHAARYGLRFIVVRRQAPGEDRPQGLLEHIWKHGLWPDGRNRFCTSDSKRGPVRALITRLVRELRAAGLVAGRPARVLNVMGMRAQESPRRRQMVPFEFDEDSSSKSRRLRVARRHVWTWLPVHSWTTEQVWADIRASGVPYHWVYDAGMPRLSCRFCVLASKSALILAAQLDPAGARARMAVEVEFQRRMIITALAVAAYARACGWPQAVPRPLAARTLRRAWRSGWKFQKARSMHEIYYLAQSRPRPAVVRDWAA